MDRFDLALAGAASALFVLLLIELGLRLPFPCDLYIWAESPFMTNMMKLWNRAPFYSDPTDVNSFIYAPGLEYVTWAVLAPFGLALDIRFCRLVSVCIGLAAAATMAAISRRVAADVAAAQGDRVRRLVFIAAAFPLAALVVFSNFTAFVPHPDDLQMLHAALSLFLCHAALRERSFGRALAAVVFSAVGVLTKQTAAFTWVGTLAALLVAGPWRGRSALALATAGVAAFSCAALPLVLTASARFFAIVLPMRQGINWSKSMVFFDDLFRGHRLILAALAPACALRIAGSDRRGRDFVVTWVALFCTAALPNLVSYMKDEGSDNNL
ncbi:MAG TPA: hypothetical protein VKU61_12745, partial [Candidatus Binatia bacterium]|nr:hypothetical protein [Candidatus Binatia bacterium]